MSLRILLLIGSVISALGLLSLFGESPQNATILFAAGFALQLFTLVVAIKRHHVAKSTQQKAEAALGEQITQLESRLKVQNEILQNLEIKHQKLKQEYETVLGLEIAYKGELAKRDEQIGTLEAKLSGEKDKQDDQAVVQFLRNLQSKGRLIDFVMTDIHRIPDPQVGAVARVVHQGLRDLMQEYFKIAPITDASEGSLISFSSADLEARYRLQPTSNSEVNPGQGRLLHRGWQATSLRLPRSIHKEDEQSLRVLAPAEVEGRDLHA